jgi:hypothetical protein
VTEAQAIDLVLAADDRFAGLQPRDEAIIGQASWYEVHQTDAGWEVVVRIGWGDCPAGCISEHHWTYEVSNTGDVVVVNERGDPLPSDGT